MFTKRVLLMLLLGTAIGLATGIALAIDYDLGDEIKISESTSKEHERPAVAYNSKHNEYLVVWQTDDGKIYGRRASRTGFLLSLFEISVVPNPTCTHPAVAYSFHADNYLVVWSQYSTSASRWEIYGRTLSWDGTGMGSPIQIAAWSGMNLQIPSVVYGGWVPGHQSYMVVWQTSAVSGGVLQGIGRRRVGTGGSLLGTAGYITTSGFPGYPDITYNVAKDEYLVVWARLGTKYYDIDIYGGRLNWQGTLQDGTFPICTDYYDQQVPAVSTNMQNRYLVVWEEQHSGIGLQFLDVNGNPDGDNFHIDMWPEVGHESYPDLPPFYQEIGEYKSPAIVYQKVNPAGEDIWAAIHRDKPGWTKFVYHKIATGGFGNNERPAVDGSVAGYFVTHEWKSFNPQDNSDIYGRAIYSPFEPARFDFDGDGKEDILWRHKTAGMVYLWLCQWTSIKAHGVLGGATADWEIQGVGDFNGDHKADILWRHKTAGTVYLWLCDGISIKAHGALGDVTADWQIKGVGDIDGDGKADIVWRHTTGTVYGWLCQGISIKAHGALSYATADWHIKKIADLDYDGKADILWRHTTGTVYIWTCDGLSIKFHRALGSVTTDWEIQGVGDFDGDHKTDILWENRSKFAPLYNDTLVWFISILDKNYSALFSLGLGKATLDWEIRGAGDFDGDFKADILWENRSWGASVTYIWFIDGTSIKSHGALGWASLDWEIFP